METSPLKGSSRSCRSHSWCQSGPAPLKHVAVTCFQIETMVAYRHCIVDSLHHVFRKYQGELSFINLSSSTKLRFLLELEVPSRHLPAIISRTRCRRPKWNQHHQSHQRSQHRPSTSSFHRFQGVEKS